MTPFKKQLEAAAEKEADKFKGIKQPYGSGFEYGDPTVSDLEIYFEKGATWALHSDVVKGLVEALKFSGKDGCIQTVYEKQREALTAFEEAMKEVRG